MKYYVELTFYTYFGKRINGFEVFRGYYNEEDQSITITLDPEDHIITGWANQYYPDFKKVFGKLLLDRKFFERVPAVMNGDILDLFEGTCIGKVVTAESDEELELLYELQDL